VKYEKPTLTVGQQVDLLESRGMLGDPADMAARLATVSYYRLSAYWYPFRQDGTETLRPGTNFAVVWNRYRFDPRTAAPRDGRCRTDRSRGAHPVHVPPRTGPWRLRLRDGPDVVAVPRR